MTVEIRQGDSLTVLRSMPERSVHCCVTSPPYWGLRDYGVAGQLGLERTPDEYVGKMVEVFREVRRVLRDDGTLWLNLGDSYISNPGDRTKVGGFQANPSADRASAESSMAMNKHNAGLKPKDLIGIPWRVAFALQADGWVLRSEIIWHKPNPMPESVRDRPTKSHEQVFLLSKGKWVGYEPVLAHISDQDARWIALFLDTEGNIAVKRVERCGQRWYGAQIAFANSHRGLLEAAQNIIGGGTILERTGTNAPMYYLQFSNRQAAALLRRIYPYLIVKRRQARIAIHIQSLLRYRGGRDASRKCRTEQETEELESLWMRIKSCNQFGHPDLSDVPEPAYGHWTSARYYYDAEAIREPSVMSRPQERVRPDGLPVHCGALGYTTSCGSDGVSRNRRSVWTVPTKPFKGAHFATFPPDLIEPCILAGCPKGGTVLDPFGGAGTTAIVAHRNGRNAVLIELNGKYVEMAQERIDKATAQEVLAL